MVDDVMKILAELNALIELARLSEPYPDVLEAVREEAFLKAGLLVETLTDG